MADWWACECCGGITGGSGSYYYGGYPDLDGDGFPDYCRCCTDSTLTATITGVSPDCKCREPEPPCLGPFNPCMGVPGFPHLGEILGETVTLYPSLVIEPEFCGPRVLEYTGCVTLSITFDECTIINEDCDFCPEVVCPIAILIKACCDPSLSQSDPAFGVYTVSTALGWSGDCGTTGCDAMDHAICSFEPDIGAGFSHVILNAIDEFGNPIENPPPCVHPDWAVTGELAAGACAITGITFGAAPGGLAGGGFFPVANGWGVSA